MPFIQINAFRKAARTPLALLQRVWNLKDIGGLKGVTIVSAYTAPEIIDVLLGELIHIKGTKKTVRIFLDYGSSGYHRDEKTTEQLDALATELDKKFDAASGIFLINLGRLLHSKVMILHTAGGDKVSVGSVNFTKRGFFINEEVQVNITNADDINDVRGYIADLYQNEWCKKIPFESELQNEIDSSSREWLLGGTLFFEDKTTNPYNFQLGLPKKLLRQPALIIPGALAEVPDNISIMQLLEIPKSAVSLAWKKYCIPTCYGYWCPSQLLPYALKKIEEAVSAKRNTKIEPVLQNSELLINKFLKVFDTIEKNIIKFNKTNKTKHKWDKNTAITRLNNWIPRMIEKLSDEDNLYRLLAGVNYTVVPDLWVADEIALREFEESFCTHIVLELSKVAVQNWVAQWLRDCYDFEKGLKLESDWNESWYDESAWLQWLHSGVSDPFEELPTEWELNQKLLS